MTGDANRDGRDRRWPWRSTSAKTHHAPGRNGTRIGLLEHCGTGNLGDEATVAAVLQQIGLRWPDASMVGLSLDPSDSTRRHGIPSFAIRRSIFPCEQEWSADFHSLPAKITLKERLKVVLRANDLAFKIVKWIVIIAISLPAEFVHELFFLGRSLLITYHLDVLIICGGGQLLDWGGPWRFPYTLFKWIFLSKLTHAKCLFLNNGAGPLDKKLSRRLIKAALRLADYVSLRDLASSTLLREIGFRGKRSVVADCAWSFRIPDHIRTTDHPRSDGGLVVGIAPMAYCDPTRHWVKDEGSYRRLIHDLTDFGIRLLQRGHRLRLFSSDIWFDSQAVADLYAAISKGYSTDISNRIVCEPVASINDFLAQLSQVDCYVTCRFHGVVFAHLLNVPTLAIAPHPKVTMLMNDIGLSEYCLNISECDSDSLARKFDRLIADMDGVKAQISRKVAQFQEQLTAQFDELFPFKADAITTGMDSIRYGA